MVREYHVIILPVNYISVFCMELCISDGSYIKFTYMIGRTHNHMMLLDHANISLVTDIIQRNRRKLHHVLGCLDFWDEYNK